MKSLTSTNGGWLRKVTPAGLIPLLLAQVLIALFSVPETLNAGTEIRREMTWEQLPAFLDEEKKVTVVLAEGGAVRGDVVGVPDNGIHMGRVSMTTNGWRYPTGSDALIPRSSVKEIRVEKMRSSLRHSGAVGLGILGGCFFPTALRVRGWWFDWEETWRRPTRTWTDLVIGTVGGASLGYWLGKRKDRETTTIMIAD